MEREVIRTSEANIERILKRYCRGGYEVETRPLYRVNGNGGHSLVDIRAAKRSGPVELADVFDFGSEALKSRNEIEIRDYLARQCASMKVAAAYEKESNGIAKVTFGFWLFGAPESLVENFGAISDMNGIESSLYSNMRKQKVQFETFSSLTRSRGNGARVIKRRGGFTPGYGFSKFCDG